MLAYLVELDEPATVKQISVASGQHVNTTREHLDALVELGLVDRGTEARQSRGRPAVTYRASEAAATVNGVREYSSLVDALAAYVQRTSEDPAAAAIIAGKGWAESMGPVPDPVEMLADMGFAPQQVSEGVLCLTRCPLLSSARRNPEVVCNVHLGLIRGLTSDDADVKPFVEGGCRVILPGVIPSSDD